MGGTPALHRFDLHLAGEGFGAAEGAAVRGALIVLDPGGRRIRAWSEAVVEGGAFELQFGGVLARGEARSWELDVSVAAEGGCEPEAPAFRIPLGTLAGQVDLALTPDTPRDPAACRSFPSAGGYDASVGARGGFGAHEGQVVSAALSLVRDGLTLAGPIQEAVVVGGRFEILFVGLLADELREVSVIDYFADVDGDGACDPPPEDHVWRLPLGKGSGNSHHLVGDEGGFSAEGCRSFTAR